MSYFDKVIGNSRSKALSSLRKVVDAKRPKLVTPDRKSGKRLSVSVPAIPHQTYAMNNPDPHWRVIIRQEGSEDSPERVVVASLPESIAMDIQSNWDAPYAEGFFGNGKLGQLMRIGGYNPVVQSLTSHFWQGNTPINLSIPLVFVAYENTLEITNKILLLEAMALPTKAEGTGFLKSPGPTLDVDMSKLLPYAEELGNVAAEGGKLVGRLAGNAIGFGGDTEKASQSSEEIFNNLRQLLQRATSALDKQSVITVKNKISVKMGTFKLFDDVVIDSISEQVDLALAPDGRPIKTQVTVNFRTRVTPVFEDVARMHLHSLDDKAKSENRSR